MDIRFERVAWREILPDVRRHLTAQPGRIDAFLEERIVGSAHYRVRVGDEGAGIAAIHNASLITLFALDAPFRRHGQAVFRELRRMEQVTAAFVPTCDPFFVAHALDEHRELRPQAYVFALGPEVPAVAAGWSLRPATVDDAPFIRAGSGDFFDPVERRIADGQLFLTLRDREPVGIGILEPSAIYGDVASVGMFTLERARQAGVGTATTGLLIQECERRGLAPVAGCWYYNHRSKRTLERAGLHAPIRLLRVEY